MRSLYGTIGDRSHLVLVIVMGKAMITIKRDSTTLVFPLSGQHCVKCLDKFKIELKAIIFLDPINKFFKLNELEMSYKPYYPRIVVIIPHKEGLGSIALSGIKPAMKHIIKAVKPVYAEIAPKIYKIRSITHGEKLVIIRVDVKDVTEEHLNKIKEAISEYLYEEIKQEQCKITYAVAPYGTDIYINGYKDSWIDLAGKFELFCKTGLI